MSLDMITPSPAGGRFRASSISIIPAVGNLCGLVACVCGAPVGMFALVIHHIHEAGGFCKRDPSKRLLCFQITQPLSETCPQDAQMCIMTLNRQPGPREQQVLVDRCTQRYCMKTFQEIIVIRGDDTAVNTPGGGVRVRGRTHLSPPLPLSNRSMLQPEWPDVVEFIMGRRNRDGV